MSQRDVVHQFAALPLNNIINKFSELAKYVFCFEFFFAFYLYSNALKFVINFPSIGIDETVLLALLSMVIGARIILKNGIHIHGLTIVVFYLIYITFVLLSWTWSDSEILAKQYMTYLYSFQLWNITAGALILASSRERCARFITIVIIFSIFIALNGIYIYHAYGTFRFYDGFEKGIRVYNRWGYAVAFGCVAAFAVFCYARPFSRRKIYYGLIFVTLFYFLMIGTSRGALLSALVGISSFVIFLIPQIKKNRGIIFHHSYIIFVVGILGFSIFIFYTISQGESFGTLTRFIKLYDQSQNTALVFGANRFTYYSEAIHHWSLAPFFGNGVAEFSIFVHGYEMSGGHPHNLVLEILTDTGMVGLTIFAAFMWVACKNIRWERLQRDPLLVVISMMFFSKFVAGMYSTEISLMNDMFVSIGMLAVSSQSSELKKRRITH